MGFIYKITNKLNGKIYVGKTARTLDERMKEHLRKIETYVERAIAKYGIDAFDVSVIEECDDEKLNEREIYWIAFYNCRRPNGYNLTDGGEGCTGLVLSSESRAKISKAKKGKKGHPCSVETRRKISKANKGHSVSEETRARISAAQIGKKATKEQRQKISARLKGRNSRLKNVPIQKNSRAVICVETNQIFHSVGAASKWASVDRSTLRAAINKETRTARGYHWRYLDNDDNKTHVRQKRAVKNVETGKVFESITSAARGVDIDISTILMACNKPNRTAGGYHWVDAN